MSVPIHLPTEEPVLGNLKFSAKGTKREVFGMTIPNELINDVIRGADYYDAYLEKVAKHQRYLAGEEVSDPDSPAPKPAKPTKQTKPKPTKQSKPTEPKAASKKPKPHRPKPSKERSEAWFSKQLVDEFIDEGVPAAKPRLEDTEEEIFFWGPLPSCEYSGENDTGKFQPLPEGARKGEREVVRTSSPSSPQTFRLPKKKSRLTIHISETFSPFQLKQLVVGLKTKARLDQTLCSHWTNLEHSDVEITDPSSQPQHEHMDEGFTAEAYPDVQENLKLTSSMNSFGDQFLNDKPSEADNEKTTADTKAESMVSVTVQ
ncbi:hypothetical protein Tco_0414637 [Tanacetum coccineum]